MFSRAQGIIESLNKLHKELSKSPPDGLGNGTDDFWKWKSLRNDIISENIFTLLLGKEGYGNSYCLDEMIYLCQREGGSCPHSDWFGSW